VAPRPPQSRAEGREEPRLVVFGDSDFASNQGIEAYRNRDLFVNSVNWLLGDVEAISVRPPKSRASRLTLSSEQFSQIRAPVALRAARADRGARRAGLVVAAPGARALDGREPPHHGHPVLVAVLLGGMSGFEPQPTSRKLRRRRSCSSAT
jgi:hypothetical protein